MDTHHQLLETLNQPPHHSMFFQDVLEESPISDIFVSLPVHSLTFTKTHRIEPNQLYKEFTTITKHQSGNRFYRVTTPNSTFLAIVASKELDGFSTLHQTAVYLYQENNHPHFLASFVQIEMPSVNTLRCHLSMFSNCNEVTTTTTLVQKILEHDATQTKLVYARANVPSNLNTGLHGTFDNVSEFLEYYKNKYSGYLHHQISQDTGTSQTSPISVNPNIYPLSITTHQPDIAVLNTNYGPLTVHEPFVLKTPSGNRIYQFVTTDEVAQEYLAILSHKETKNTSLEIDIEIIHKGHVYQTVASFGHHPQSHNAALRHGVIPHLSKSISQTQAETMVQAVYQLEAARFPANTKWSN
jgi:hypothetical protein